MARTFGKVLCSIWGDPEFRALEPEAQRCYMLLLSQPDISPAGVLPFVPARWAAGCDDTTPEDVIRAVSVLQRSEFVVVDGDTVELLVRTFVLHDGGLANGKMRGAIKNALPRIHSKRLRGVVEDLIPDELRQDFGLGERRSNGDGSPIEGRPKGDRSATGSPSQKRGEGEGVGSTGTSSDNQKETAADAAPPSKKWRDELFDALADVWPAKTRAEKTRIATAVSKLAGGDDLTPTTARERSLRLLQKAANEGWSDVTVMALPDWWTRLGTPNGRRRAGPPEGVRCQTCGKFEGVDCKGHTP